MMEYRPSRWAFARILAFCGVICSVGLDKAYSQFEGQAKAPPIHRQTPPSTADNSNNKEPSPLTTGRLPSTGHVAGFGVQGNGGAKNRFGDDIIKRRTVSPYLSVLDNGGGLNALNYYNIVRPQQRAQKAARSFRNELRTVETELQRSEAERLRLATGKPITSGRMPPTGHSASFGYMGGYFPSNSAGGSNRGRR